VTFRETAWQVAKEQWIPALVTATVSGLLWLYVLQEGKGWSIGTAAGVASPWAAFIAGLVATWFRIRKGHKTDRTLSTIETNVQRMLSNFDVRITDLVGQVTGGQSSPYLKVDEDRGKGPFFRALATVIGAHSLREVSLKVECIAPFYANLGTYEIGTIPFGHARHVTGPTHDLHAYDTYSFKLTFFALNGTTTQLLFYRQTAGSWLLATAVAGHGRIVHSEMDPGYPESPDWAAEMKRVGVELGGAPYNPLA
jgi:hypothetical protein